MQVTEEARYRLRLADGFLLEARQDMELKRWRSCVDNSQLAAENAAKTLLALLGPLGRTHNPAVLLREALEEKRFPPGTCGQVERVIDCAKLLGQDVHIESDYGDEAAGRTPWELFDEHDAQQSLALAEEAARLVRQIIASCPGP